jgi:hypothetical protein
VEINKMAKQPKVVSALEKVVKADIKAALAEAGAWHFMPVQTGYGKTGVPDFLACVPVKIRPEHVGLTIGLFVAIEAKRLDGELTMLQEDQIAEIAASGACTGVVYGTKSEPGNFKKFMQDLDRLVGAANAGKQTIQ